MSQHDDRYAHGNDVDPASGDEVTTSYPVSEAAQSELSSTTGVAADQARQVGQEAVDSGRQVAQVAASEASSVASEAGAQAKNLLGEARTQLTDQAATQQNNLASWLSSLVDELDQMVDRTSEVGNGAGSGAATSLVRQVSSRARTTATWLEDHEPADLLNETSKFARQRPGLFLALAAAAGLLAGRLTRGLTADAEPDAVTSSGTYASRPVTNTPAVVGTTTSDPYAAPSLEDDTTAGRQESEPAWDVR
jgi:ElaB/YqjD/DUF883 family membrane-anchored ribosome-binding protein